MGYSWFPQEQMSEEEMELHLNHNANDFTIDIVLSHTCPLCFEPTDLFLPMVDQSVVDKTMERFLGMMERKLDYKVWLFGHYHSLRDYPRTDGRKKLMIFNHKAIDLIDYVENEEFKIY